MLPPRPGQPSFQHPVASLPPYSRPSAGIAAPLPLPANVAEALGLDSPKVAPISKWVFLTLGMLLLVFVSLLPVWDALSLTKDFNYVFWQGQILPWTLICVCVALPVIFLLMTEIAYSFGRTTQTLVSVISVTMTILALLLVSISMPLSSRAAETANSLMQTCASSPEPLLIRNHYLDLLRLRQTPDCAQMSSVEACAGFVEKQPYTAYLKDLETNYKCSGFCFEAPKVSLVERPPDDARGKVRLSFSKERSFFGRTRDKIPAVSALELDAAGKAMLDTARDESLAEAAPPTLFSTANFKATCHGAAARNMLVFGREVGFQMWYLGIALLSLSIVIGVLEWGAIIAK